MKSRVLYVLGVLSLGLCFAGCSFSASVGNMHTLEGKDSIKVAAAQPELPPEPEPEPEPVQKPAKAKVVGKKIEISEKVMFEYNSAEIKEESHALLNDVATVIKDAGKKIKVIKIEGHTDSDGKDDYNLELSQKRADSVMAFLIEAGVSEDKLEAIGYGEDKPIADNATDEGKEANRRVEFNLVEKKTKKNKNKNKKNKKSN